MTATNVAVALSICSFVAWHIETTMRRSACQFWIEHMVRRPRYEHQCAVTISIDANVETVHIGDRVYRNGRAIDTRVWHADHTTLDERRQILAELRADNATLRAKIKGNA